LGHLEGIGVLNEKQGGDSLPRLVDISVTFPGFTLAAVNAVLPHGCTALLGTNGAGKTTLMRSMLGLEPGASGHLALDGLRSDVRSDRRALMARIGWVRQAPEYPRFVTVRQCVAHAADLKGLRGPAAAEAVELAAARADLSGELGRAASQLSGGQQKRLAIAQATVHAPEFLVLDEPTASLDPVQRLEFREWLTEYAQSHYVLISTHMAEDVEDISTHALVLHDGRLVFDGSTKDLLDKVNQGEGSLDRATAALFLREISR